jgi:hypothetical protein
MKVKNKKKIEKALDECLVFINERILNDKEAEEEKKKKATKKAKLLK